MKTEWKGFMKIFAFTFQQQIRRRGWLLSTILVAVLCFAVPFGILTGIAYFSGDEPEPVAAPEESGTMEPAVKPEENEAVDMSALKHIYVVNLTDRYEFSAGPVSEGLAEYLPDVNFIDYGDHLETAAIDCGPTNHTLVVVTEKEGGSYVMNLLTPEESLLPEEIRDQVAVVLSSYGDTAVGQINDAQGVSQDTAVNEAGYGHAETDGEEEMMPSAEYDPVEDIRQILGFVIPYLNIMILYFFVLFYGQGVAQSVITEKTSKLMEFFLVSVKPTAMILGKLTAVCLCGVIQLGSWILCLLGGFLGGGVAAAAISGGRAEADMAVLQLMDTFGEGASSMFSVSGMVLALLMMAAGMFLYCSLAGVGGALAGKPEDLSSTNMAFTLVLVISFFACLVGGGMEGLDGGAAWLDWIPFTAIMVTPARILLGSVSVMKGFASLLLVIGTTLIITVIAGRLYQMMALYRGDVPGPKKLLQMIKEK